MIVKQLQLVLTFFLLCHWVRLSSGHGRLWDPTSRSSMWRRGFDTPKNYQDNELWCGGLNYQISQGYKCGVCGDPYAKPRENEAGGKYATGMISQSYIENQIATFNVDLSVFHKGYFEFKICPTNDPNQRETQECFDRYPVSLADGSGTRFYPDKAKFYQIDVDLPEDLVCNFCVLQWRYHTGNGWGTEPNGTSCIGCGQQEEFYGCADIEILSYGSSDNHTGKRPIKVNSDRTNETSIVSDNGNSKDQDNDPGGGESSVSDGGDFKDLDNDSGKGENDVTNNGNSTCQDNDLGNGENDVTNTGNSTCQDNDHGNGENDVTDNGHSEDQDNDHGNGENDVTDNGHSEDQDNDHGNGENDVTDNGHSEDQDNDHGNGENDVTDNGHSEDQDNDLGNGENDVTDKGHSEDQDNDLGNGENDAETICRGAHGQTMLDEWCSMNCKLQNCPSSHCECETRPAPPRKTSYGCRAHGSFSTVPGLDNWCSLNCAAGNCPTMCVCN